jgi:hypothetical protein
MSENSCHVIRASMLRAALMSCSSIPQLKMAENKDMA